MRAERLPVLQLPPVLTAAGATIHLPIGLPALLDLQIQGSAVDLVLAVTRAPEPLVAAVVTVAFVDPDTGAELVVSGLTDPIKIVFHAANATALHQPVVDWYQCVHEVCRCVGARGWCVRLAPPPPSPRGRRLRIGG